MLGLSILLFFGAYTRDWTESTPTDKTVANQIDNYNRYLRVDVAERLEDYIGGFNASDTNAGFYHILFIENADTLSTPAANKGLLYGKLVNSKCELFYLDEDGDEVQLTTGGDMGGGHVQLLAGMDLLGSATSDITINTNKFTVAGATGNTLVAGTLDAIGVATLGDASLLKTSAAPTTNAMIANKKYVDDHVGHDGDGYVLRDIDGTPTKVYTKYLTGSLDGDDTTLVEHGCSVTKILSLTAAVWDDNQTVYRVLATQAVASANHSYTLVYGSTYVQFRTVGAYLQSNAYRIKIDYYL